MTVKKERGPQKGPLKGFGGSWKGLGLEGTRRVFEEPGRLMDLGELQRELGEPQRGPQRELGVTIVIDCRLVTLLFVLMCACSQASSSLAFEDSSATGGLCVRVHNAHGFFSAKHSGLFSRNFWPSFLCAEIEGFGG